MSHPTIDPPPGGTTQLSGSFTVQVDVSRLARLVAAHILDALNAAEFADRLGDYVSAKVADQVNAEFAPYSGQGWQVVEVQPPWSGYCWHGEHDRCDGSAPPSEGGCQCPHHRGEPVGWYKYVPPSAPGEQGEQREYPGPGTDAGEQGSGR